MGHHSSSFFDIVGNGAAILPGLVGSMLLVIFLWLCRRGRLSRRQQFDHLWPVFVIWLVTMGQSILKFMPHSPRWIQIMLLCIEAAVCAVVWRKTRQTIRQAPPEYWEEFRMLTPLGRVKPIYLVLAAGLVIVAGGVIGYVMGG